MLFIPFLCMLSGLVSACVIAKHHLKDQVAIQSHGSSVNPMYTLLFAAGFAGFGPKTFIFSAISHAASAKR
jgi:hypothetical protein